MIFLVSVPIDKLEYEIRGLGLERGARMKGNKAEKTGYCEWQWGAAFFEAGFIPSVPYPHKMAGAEFIAIPIRVHAEARVGRFRSSDALKYITAVHRTSRRPGPLKL